jgi:endonuclease/exonuclease/phosphatase family metal-dependent hydrolase
MKKELRVLTYNIHKGFSLDRRFVLSAMREAIQSTHADLVFLQEVQGQHLEFEKKYDNWPEQSQMEFLASATWPHGAYGKNAVYSQGHHGNAILSSRPISKFENIDISNNRFERRGLLHAILAPDESDSQEVHLICLHLDLFQRGRKKQLEKLMARINESVPGDSPLIIAGDFNDWLEYATQLLKSELGVLEVHQTLHGHHAKSFPARMPFLSLDRIYVRGLAPVQAQCFTQNPWSRLSDHGALFTELRYPEAEKKK